MLIRSYHSDDEAALVDLWHACGLVRPGNDPRKDIERKLRAAPQGLLVGEVAGKVVASVMLGYEGRRGWINYLAVAPEYQKRGFGRAMMERAEILLRSQGCPKVNLQVRTSNAQVIGFYGSLGYGVDEVVSLGKRLLQDAPPGPHQAASTEFPAGAVSAAPPRRVVVIFPDVSPEHAIHRLRRRFDPLVDLIAPHLTLVFPFSSPLSPEQLRQHVTQCTRSIGAFEIRLRGVTAHEDEYLFLNVKRGGDMLVDLHDRLYSGPLAEHLSPWHTFVPHLTVGRLTDRGALAQALADRCLRDVAFDFRAEALTVYTAEDDGSRVPESIVALSG